MVRAFFVALTARLVAPALILFAVATAFLLTPTVAIAAETLSLAQLDHTAWRAHDGAPINCTVMMQDRSGVLWMGSSSGLFSFDGISFSQFSAGPGEPQLTLNVKSMSPSGDGAIWLGLNPGGIVEIRDGHIVRAYGEKDGLAVATVEAVAQGPDGTMWAVVRNRILVLKNEHWTPLPVAKSLGDAPVRNLFVTRAGQLYVLSDTGTWLMRGVDDFVRVSAGGRGQLFETRSGSLWRYTINPGDALNTVELVGADVGDDSPHKAVGEFNFPLWDSEGMLWLPTATGVSRAGKWSGASPLATLPHEDSMGRSEGLSGGYVWQAFEDKSGDVWVSTSGGIDRFRTPHLVRRLLGESVVEPLLTSCPVGHVWMASGRGMSLADVDDVKSHRSGPDLNQIYALYCASDDSLWVAAEAGLWRVVHGVPERLPDLPGIEPFMVREFSEGPFGVYASVTRSGLWRMSNGQWKRLDLGKDAAPPISLSRAKDGSLWCGFIDGTLVRFDGHQSTLYLPESPGGVGTIEVITQSPRYGLLVGGVNGFGLLQNGKIRALHGDDVQAMRGVSGLVESDQGDVWLNGSSGLVELPGAELDAAVHHSDYTMRTRRFVESDIAGPSPQILKIPTAVKRGDGVLWFSTSNTVVSVDPRELHPSDTPPSLVGLSLWTDDKPAAADHHILAGNHTVRVHFLGVQLDEPERVRYRYWLEGLDTGWGPETARTDSYYSAMKPGRYVFHLMASNGDGVWTPEDKSLEFEVLPAFYQTKSFIAASVALGLILLFAAMTARIRMVERAIRKSAEDRANERVRIARDLHDTLLQGMQGLMLRFHVASQGLPTESKERLAMETALTRADELLLEGRDRVTRLRADIRLQSDLPPAIEATCRALNHDLRVKHEIAVHGTPIELKAHVSQEVFLLAREALTNAYRHGAPSRIQVTITYSRQAFELTIADDGEGFDVAAALPFAVSRGSWGLTGMKERASNLHAKLRLTSQVGKGTVVHLTLPAWRAYDRLRELKMDASRLRKALTRRLVSTPSNGSPKAGGR